MIIIITDLRTKGAGTTDLALYSGDWMWPNEVRNIIRYSDHCTPFLKILWNSCKLLLHSIADRPTNETKNNVSPPINRVNKYLFAWLLQYFTKNMLWKSQKVSSIGRTWRRHVPVVLHRISEYIVSKDAKCKNNSRSQSRGRFDNGSRNHKKG